MGTFYYSDEEEGHGGGGVCLGDYESAFLKAGFKRRKNDDRLTWKGLPYPEVKIEYQPDPWGREQEDEWASVTYLAEPHEGARGFKTKVVMEVTLSSKSEARDLAERWADDARRDAALMAKIQPGTVVLDPKGVQRRVMGIWRFKDGTPEAAPLVLEGLKKRLAYCQVDIPDTR